MTPTTPASSNAADSQIIDGRYCILASLGEGNSGTTYLAKALDGGSQVALKALSLRGSQDWKTLELFEREVEILKSLDHPAIPRYIESFVVETETDRYFYLVQTLAEGKNLADWVERGWRCTEAEVEAIAKQLLEILSYLQSLDPVVIHRDLKPQNIIRRQDGRIALVDFGAVGHSYHNTFMRGSTVVGTFGYMAPEQFRAQAYPATDLYSLGATLVFLLTRRSPAELPMNQLKLDFRSKLNLSPAFADWLEKLLEPELEKRFASAKQAQTALKYRSLRRRIPTPARSSTQHWLMALLLLGALGIGSIIRYPYKFLVMIEDGRPIEGELLSGKIPPQRFLNRGGSTSARSRYAPTLFAAALQAQNKAITQEMLEQGFDPSQVSANGDPVLHMVVRSGDIVALKTLLALFPQLNLKQLNQRQETALFLSPTEEVALELLNAGATSHAHKSGLSDFAISQGWDMALRNYIEQLRTLEPDAATPMGSDLLRKLIQTQNWPIADFCIEQGCKLMPEDVAGINLATLLELKQENLLSALIDLSSIDVVGTTLLHIAAYERKVELTKALLNHGADPTRVSKRGEKAIEEILRYVTVWSNFNASEDANQALFQRQEIFWSLIDAGEDINQHIDGKSPLHWSVETAKSGPELQFLEQLIQRGADVNHPSSGGGVPLHDANSIRKIELLLAAGANPNLANSRGETPIFRRTGTGLLERYEVKAP